jgi:signal transduction histidine kinase
MEVWKQQECHFGKRKYIVGIIWKHVVESDEWRISSREELLMTETTPTHKKIVLQQDATTSPEQLFEVYHLSHDLRGPLNSILGFTELLQEEVEGPLNEIQKEDISAINQSAKNLLQLINDMVDLSKLAAGRLDFNLGELYFNQIVNTILASDLGGNKPKEIELVVNLPESLPLLWGDSNRIEQMILSLLDFAFKLKKTGEITITADGGTTNVTIQIHLAGVFVSAQDLEDYFKLMVKVDAAGRSHIGPGGLGLPLVRFIAEKQQGRVWAECKEGRGTTFYLSLPVYNEASQEA